MLEVKQIIRDGCSSGRTSEVRQSLVSNTHECCVHGTLRQRVVPQVFFQSLIVPISKDNNGNIINQFNYQRMAISSVISTKLELILP